MLQYQLKDIKYFATYAVWFVVFELLAFFKYILGYLGLIFLYLGIYKSSVLYIA
jgi:hypothetical protein